MTPNRFQQVRNLFEAALEHDPDTRGAFLDQACANDLDLRQEIDRLLEAHEATVTRGPWAALPSSARTELAAREGRRIGDYEVLRQLGSGGMGSVYLAQRADQAFQKNVAIKILRSDVASTDVIKRFQREREILARLDHPNISRLLDAGETEDGLPYFVMEYVEGRSIAQYADAARLSVDDRITLFRQVCDAVDYAHQRKIAHRDLKPGNVLVTAEGRVKLLDFGIAGLLEQDAGMANLTRPGMWLMTPEYASPEQVRGEPAGRASDVYSLGVILFELLTGHRPYHVKGRIFHEVVRIVCEEPPTKPSTVVTQPIEAGTSTLPPEMAGRLRQTSLDELKRQLSGDLDNILLKALDKQPQDRYPSAQQLRADIDRHVRGEAVWASGHSPLYRVGRFLSRFRVALVGLAALAAAVATGAATVRLLWWVAGAAGLLAVWYAATDRNWGRKIGGVGILSSGSGLFVGYLIVRSALSFTEGRLETRLPGLTNFSDRGLLVAWALFAAYQLGAWLIRGRWSGPLLVDLGRNTSVRVRREWGRSLVVIGLMVAALAIVRSSGPYWATGLVSTGVLILLFVRTEVRDEGFLKGGRLIRWRRIASWEWRDLPDWQRSPAPDPVLVLHLHRRIQFWPPLRIRIPASMKDTVEEVLKRQLGEWPTGFRSAQETAKELQ
jgi:serine/threonine protein kinase